MRLAIFKLCSDVGVSHFPPLHLFSDGLSATSARPGAGSSQDLEVSCQLPHWLLAALGRTFEADR